MKYVVLHLRHKWAVCRGNHRSALEHMESIIMLDFSKLEAAANALVNQDHADEAAAAAANAAVADAQTHIDTVAATLTAAIVVPATVVTDPAAPAA